ncbi:unnamed protein product [Heligmosomoides polygyrus]|uniref:SLC12 domain-containing protein n=1 Tax=Heligmosomoides polygyrus TaxID=6339 RepID=A0A183FLN0_HELPZ|nr:unnamed protein product [Heligmosomoides polygyrus]
MVMALQAKIPQAIADGIEEDRRMRSIVITGNQEEPQDLPPSRSQGDLEDKVSGILDALQVECRPESVYRMGFSPIAEAAWLSWFYLPGRTG